jgi:hypothetical protein
MKQVIRQLLFVPICMLTDGYLTAEEGTLWGRFLVWLYGKDGQLNG